ncbi:unnamed protein product [Penicillium salamii]|uniref:EKC/KEOPS complex subunit BUD32 n=1 Tax=Penicillium salamii TaxID=1612424 RepID=A0A9W4JSL1_9EURO|nr:unnamed protein product [Penicillium salamii]
MPKLAHRPLACLSIRSWHIPRSTARFSARVQELDANELESSRSPSYVGQVHEILQSHGLLKINLKFPDESSSYLTQLISALSTSHGHGVPITHSSSRGWFWEVRPQSTAASASKSETSPPQNAPARSETSESFPWHTDCSYEESPPRFFALQVLHADACGGGTLSVMELSRLLPLLSATARKYLSRAEYRIAVPPEFIKKDDQRSIIGSLLTNPDDGLRFREDIITPLTPSAGQAFEELKSMLRSPEARSSTIPLSPEVLPSGSIVLVENRRWLHARNEVRDPMRHLRRVRWDARPFAETIPGYVASRYYPNQIGEIIKNRYQVVGKLGFGATSTVWLARDMEYRRYVTLKIFIKSTSLGQQLDDELNIYKRIGGTSQSHPGHKYVRSQIHRCLVHPPLWESVLAFLHRNPIRRLPTPVLVVVLHRLFLALDYLHTKCKIIHTDIRADNIMFSIADDSVFSDFEENELQDPSPKGVRWKVNLHFPGT